MDGAVVASEKGVVVGRLTFSEDGDAIDCSKMGVGGKAIPPNIDKVRGCLQLTREVGVRARMRAGVRVWAGFRVGGDV